MMPLGNRQFSARGQDAPRTAPLLPTAAGSRTTGGVYSGSSIGWSCIVGRSSCRRVLLVLGGALLARHWPRVAPGARRGTARGVWRVVAHDQSGWVALGR